MDDNVFSIYAYMGSDISTPATATIKNTGGKISVIINGRELSDVELKILFGSDVEPDQLYEVLHQERIGRISYLIMYAYMCIQEYDLYSNDPLISAFLLDVKKLVDIYKMCEIGYSAKSAFFHIRPDLDYLNLEAPIENGITIGEVLDHISMNEKFNATLDKNSTVKEWFKALFSKMPLDEFNDFGLKFPTLCYILSDPTLYENVLNGLIEFRKSKLNR